MHRFADDDFCASHVSTIGVDFKVRTVKRDDGKSIKLQLWDTAGQERFRTITTAYYRNADGIILVYSSASMNSFKNISHWISEIERYSKEGCCTMMIANKSDLKSQRQVDAQEAAEVTTQLGIPLIETSAKDAIGVEEAFFKMVDQIHNSKLAHQLKRPSRTADSGKSKEVFELTENRFTTAAAWLMTRCSIM